MSTPKHKHLTYEDRFVIQEFLNLNHTFTSISFRLDKDRRCIAKEVYKHRVLRPARVKKDPDCPKTSKAPYVCNGCPSKDSCRKTQYRYDAAIAHSEYEITLRRERAHLKITKNRAYKLMLIYVLPYKKSIYVLQVFEILNPWMR